MIMKATDQRIRAEILARYDVDARRCREVFFSGRTAAARAGRAAGEHFPRDQRLNLYIQELVERIVRRKLL